MTAYYNEYDPHAAAWLRELITAGLIAPGDVDERSIEDVGADDLAGYTQCHFFAGIGGWSRALRLAGWPDDRPVWTGSPPCQPFSAAGRRGGYDDARHLAPAWLDLVSQRRPPVVFGEQVASAITGKNAWLDDLQDHLEEQGYATGAVVLPACGIGAPHIRQRLWFVAQRMGDGQLAGLEGHRRDGDHGQEPGRLDAHPNGSTAEAGSAGRVANANGSQPRDERQQRSGEHGQRTADGSVCMGPGCSVAGGKDESCGLADVPVSGCREERADSGGIAFGDSAQGQPAGHGAGGSDHRPSPDHGFWSACDWLYCRDGKWRPIKRGAKPLVAGLPRGVVPSRDPSEPGYADETAEARVMRLKGYGNAIVPPVAAEVIAAFVETNNPRTEP